MPVASAREFLARALPWPDPSGSGPPTYVNIHHKLAEIDGKVLVDQQGRPKPVFPGRACRDVAEAANYIDWVLSRNTDLYVCMSEQTVAKEKQTKNNRPYYAAVRSGANVSRIKSLFVDVDVKPGDLLHGYATTIEAATEFGAIRRALGLPAPTFTIMSGSGGFHAHWCFTEGVTSQRWQRLAAGLCAAFLEKGFRGDTQCIVDVVRLLRVPGTFNYKAGLVRPVTQLGASGNDYLVEALEGVLQPWLGAARVVAVARSTGSLGAASPVFQQSVANADDLGAGLERDVPTIDEVATGCPFVARSLASGGANNSNPLWLQTTNIALFVKDARLAAHRMSSSHTTYDAVATDQLFERQLETKQTRDMGWPRCQTIASYGAPECVNCPRLQAAKSPLNIQPAAVSTVASAPLLATTPSSSNSSYGSIGQSSLLVASLPPIPTGYTIDQHGVFCRIETDEQGVQTNVPLTSFPMDKPWLQVEPATLNFSTFTHVGHERQIRVPYEVVADKAQLPKILARQGMLIQEGERRGLGAFMVSWVEKMRRDRDNIVQSTPFGWSVVDGKVNGFVYAGHLWSKDQPRPAANPDAVLASQYSPSGELDPWLAASRMVTDQHRAALNALLAGAFGAPLVRFTGQTGLLMSTYSAESGIGKSTTMKIAQAVWAHPQKAVQSLNDTQNSVIKKIGDIKNLPLFWDELKTEEDTKKFINLAFQLSQGKEKSRLAADTTYREPGTWQTLLCCTSNESLLNHVLAGTKTTSAGLYRVFEFAVPRGVKGQISPATAQLLTSALNDNYGMAGLRYAQFLGANHARVAKEVELMSRGLEKAHNIQADERFWLALITVVVMGAYYANEVGLTEIDVPDLKAFMLKQFGLLRGERHHTPVDMNKSLNVLEYLARFLNDQRRNYSIVTNVVHRGQGRPPAYAVGAPNAPGVVTSKGTDQFLRAVHVHYGADDHWVRVSESAFEAWLSQDGVTPPTIIKHLVEQFGVSRIRGRMGIGTVFATAAERLLEFNYDEPRFQGFIDI